MAFEGAGEGYSDLASISKKWKQFYGLSDQNKLEVWIQQPHRKFVQNSKLGFSSQIVFKVTTPLTKLGVRARVDFPKIPLYPSFKNERFISVGLFLLISCSSYISHFKALLFN